MEKLRNSIVRFVLFLGIVYSLGNIGDVNQSLVNMQPFVFILALSIAILLIWAGQWLEIKLLYSFLTSLAIYFICKLILFRNPPMIDENNVYLALVEILFILGVVYLAHQVMCNLRKYGLVLDDAILPKIKSRVLRMEDEEGLIENEFIRGRRYQFPITTIVIQPGGERKDFPTEAELEQAINEIGQNIKKRYLSTWLVKIISDLARSTDYVVTMNDSEKLLIVAPGSSSENAQSLVNRINKKITEEVGISPIIGLATFPEDGPTLEAVLDKAIGRMLSMDKDPMMSKTIEVLAKQGR